MRYIDEIAGEAKNDSEKLEVLIKEYEHFILSCASKISGHYVDKSSDEWSVALLAFYEAVQSYERKKGGFLAYANLLIRSRLIDYFRTQKKHSGQISYELIEDDQVPGQDRSIDISFEIEALEQALKTYGIALMELTSSSPKADKTRQACKKAIRFLLKSPVLINEMRRTKLLPIKIIEINTGVPRKLIERHRKYIVTAVEVLHDDYPYLSEYFDYIREENQ